MAIKFTLLLNEKNNTNSFLKIIVSLFHNFEIVDAEINTDYSDGLNMNL